VQAANAKVQRPSRSSSSTSAASFASVSLASVLASVALLCAARVRLRTAGMLPLPFALGLLPLHADSSSGSKYFGQSKNPGTAHGARRMKQAVLRALLVHATAVAASSTVRTARAPAGWAPGVRRTCVLAAVLAASGPATKRAMVDDRAQADFLTRRGYRAGDKVRRLRFWPSSHSAPAACAPHPHPLGISTTGAPV